MRAWILVSFAVLALAGTGAAIFACDGEKIDVTCDQIPDGGCPASGDADLCTADPTCAAVYTCTDKRWIRLTTCAARPSEPDAAPAVDASSSKDASAFDGSLPEGAWGGPGCLDLQLPDCSLGLASTCGGKSCCDCEDVFVCSGGAWALYGSCQNGQITAAP